MFYTFFQDKDGDGSLEHYTGLAGFGFCFGADAGDFVTDEVFAAEKQ